MDDLEEFRAMLNAVRRTNFDNGVAAERERIIALLTPPDYERCECHLWQSDCLFCRTTLPEVIALIKGENK